MKNIRIKNGFSIVFAMLFIIFYLVISSSFVNGQCDFNKISAATNLYEFGKFEDETNICSRSNIEIPNYIANVKRADVGSCDDNYDMGI